MTINNHYLNVTGYPSFITPYLSVPELVRLKNIDYFCGMRFASKEIYNFKYDMSRFDHSLTTSLITWHLTKDKDQTIAALFHDIATPCFSHVIDYVNNDYITQESTESKTKDILLNSKLLLSLLKNDGVDIYNIINYKQYSIVDNDRPKLCADRLDGVIRNSLSWSKTLDRSLIEDILKDLIITTNEDNELEISFKSLDIANLVYNANLIIDRISHEPLDNYMMNYAKEMIKLIINLKLITEEDLYYLTEEELIKLILSSNNSKLLSMYHHFSTLKKESIVIDKYPHTKKKLLHPLVNGQRIK